MWKGVFVHRLNQSLNFDVPGVLQMIPKSGLLPL